jgi:hypothetical protein
MTGTLTLDLGLDQLRARGDRRPPSAPEVVTRAPAPAATPCTAAPAAARATRATRDSGHVADAPQALARTTARSSDAARTLDDLISGAWKDLAAHHTVACPVCTGPMAPRYGSGARPVGGRCRRCGSTLG